MQFSLTYTLYIIRVYPVKKYLHQPTPGTDNIAESSREPDEPNGPINNSRRMPSLENLVQVKTNLTVGIGVIFFILELIYLALNAQLQLKELLSEVMKIAVKVFYLTIPHIWILRSEEITMYVKRKVRAAYDFYFYKY